MALMKRTLRALLLLLVVALALEAPAAMAAYAVKISKKSAVIDLADGNTLILTSDAPANLKSKVQWKSKNTSIAQVKGGVVTAKRKGKTQIGVRVGKGKWASCTVTVVDSRPGAVVPRSMALSAPKAELVVGETFEVKATLLPANAPQTVKWQSSKPALAKVSPEGVITALKPGKLRVRAVSTKNPKLFKVINVEVKKVVVPTSLSLTPATTAMNIKAQLTLKATVSPSTASNKINWTSSDSATARVTNGVVTALKEGTVTITATSAASASVRATRTIKITDPDAVTSVTIDQQDMYLGEEKATQLTAKVLPATSNAKVSWSSNNTTVAAVDTNGKLVGRKAGTAQITVKAGNRSDTIEVRVLSDKRVSVEPDRYVAAASAITANHNKILSVFDSAVMELEANLAAKKISARERANRTDILRRGFLMYDVPWATDRNVTYWSGSTSYVANRIYFGMPYTQNNRTFHLDKWLNNVTNTKRDGYYQVTGMVNKKYPGNDCSSFVSMIQWNVNGANSYLNSRDMYVSSSYTTVSNGWNSLIPGDILVKRGHVAMFLYYVTPERIMVLEQGGGAEPNTVDCNIKSISGVYRSQGYIVRRKAGIAS